MIRAATVEDVKGIYFLAEKFKDEGEDIPFDTESVINLINFLITDDNGILLVVEVDSNLIGFVAGLIVSHPFNTNLRFASELAWYILPEYRKGWGSKLLRAYETSLVLKQADKTAMMCIESLRADVIGKLYERKGYKLKERSYVKDL